MDDLFSLESCLRDDEDLNHRRRAMLSMRRPGESLQHDIDEFVRCNLHPLLLSPVLARMRVEKKSITELAPRVADALVEMETKPHGDVWSVRVLDALAAMGTFGRPLSDTDALLRLSPRLLTRLARRAVTLEWDPPALCAVIARLPDDEARRATNRAVTGSVMLLLASPDASTNARLASHRVWSLASVALATCLQHPVAADAIMKTWKRVLGAEIPPLASHTTKKDECGSDSSRVGDEHAGGTEVPRAPQQGGGAADTSRGAGDGGGATVVLGDGAGLRADVLAVESGGGGRDGGPGGDASPCAARG